jgi:Ala-tRNA(Pro) deacylase
MPLPGKVIKFLEKAGVKYEVVEHRKVFTAHDKAATLKVHPKIVGKTLAIKIDKQLALVLIPANRNLDKKKLAKLSKAKKIDFASEKIIKSKLKGIKLGAIPPFGNLWKISTFSDKSLLKNPKIILNGGDYLRSLKMSPAAFKNISKGDLNFFSGNLGKSKK